MLSSTATTSSPVSVGMLQSALPGCLHGYVLMSLYVLSSFLSFLFFLARHPLSDSHVWKSANALANLHACLLIRRMLFKRFLVLFKKSLWWIYPRLHCLWHRWHALRLTHDPAVLQHSLCYPLDKIEPVPVACLYF